MIIIFFALYLSLQITYYIVFLDIILSWVAILFWDIRPAWLKDFVNSLYKWIKKIIPTNLWMFEFAPMIIIILVQILQWFVVLLEPDVLKLILNINN